MTHLKCRPLHNQHRLYSSLPFSRSHFQCRFISPSSEVYGHQAGIAQCSQNSVLSLSRALTSSLSFSLTLAMNHCILTIWMKATPNSLHECVLSWSSCFHQPPPLTSHCRNARPHSHSQFPSDDIVRRTH